MRARIVDISRYQGVINGAALKAAGFCGIVARCSIGWAYYDPFYENNMKEARDNNLIFGAYHVLYPANKAPQKEVDWFHDHAILHAGPLLGQSPDFIVADIELDHGLPGSEILEQSRILLAEMQLQFNMRPVVYTGSWFWDRLGPAQVWCKNYPLWEAEYLSKLIGKFKPDESPEPPKAPVSLARGWDEWKMWQWTSNGEPVGVQSSVLDYDVFNGTVEEFRAFVGASPPPLTLQQKVDKLWEAHPELH